MPAPEKIWLCHNRVLTQHSLVKRRAAGLNVRIEKAGLFRSKRRRVPEAHIGWGYKASGQWALARSGENGAFLLFEDGFIRSLKPGYTGEALYSLVEDSSGIYYDGAGKSDLVKGLEGEGSIGEFLSRADWQTGAARLLESFRRIGASKYNWFPGEFGNGDALEKVMPEPGVLVIDQTRGDASIAHGGVQPGVFSKMLDAALTENPDAPVYVRSHPDHLYRKRYSCLSQEQLNDPRIRILSANFAPSQTFSRATRIYVVSSLLGLEALLHEVPVTSFGRSFYCGWGLTDDRDANVPKRNRSRSLLELFQAAYGLYSRCFDPHTGEACGLDRILDHLELQKETFRENARERLVFGMSPWKRPVMERFLKSPSSALHWTRSRRKAAKLLEARPHAEVVVWGRKPVPQEWTETHPLIRAEDGFIRSTGLGAEFHAPLSLVFDDAGIYYDPHQPSALETILETGGFGEEERQSSRQLIDLLKSAAVTKYNLPPAESPAKWPGCREGALRILVPGQVEADASIAFGCSEWRTNSDLLKAVREHNPDAVIAYKPHPDIVKRVRDGRAFPEGIETLCDVIVTDLNILPWIESCDAVHTLTSLSGFEALLRGKPVTCYGTPFYAGWGLTGDLAPGTPRRNRKLSVEELAVGALLRYPRYAHPETGEFMTPEAAVRLLKCGGPTPFSRPWHLRLIARLKRLITRH